MAFGIALIVVGVGLFASAVFYFVVFLIFSHCPKSVVRTGATLQKVKQKNDVTLYGKEHLGRGLPKAMHIKHLSKGVYLYRVNGRFYRIRDWHVGTARQMSRIVSVVYWKRFPRIAYLDTGIGPFFELRALLLAFAGIAPIILGVSLLLN